MDQNKSAISVYDRLIEQASERGGGFLLLVDPDRSRLEEIIGLVDSAADAGVDGILVGTSFLFSSEYAGAVGKIKEATSLPVILFPGASTQVAPDADAILFMSLISGRNPQYLIEEQVRGAPQVKACGIEPIATGYMLIESGSYTSVEFVSNTRPIPRSKSDLAVAHALAAQYLGMKCVYLECGSGARYSVPEEMIAEVKRQVDIPLIVGGGIGSPEEARNKIEAGATFVVVGTRFESPETVENLRAYADACHPAKIVSDTHK